MPTEAPSRAAGRARRRLSRSSEFWVIVGLLAAFLLINIATVELYPMAWIDEDYFADPAINLVGGHGLTSSVWWNVYWGRFWYSYPPLYPLLLSRWIAVVGVNLGTMRLFNLILICAVALLLWLYAVRSGLFRSMAGRVALVLLPVLGYGISLAYRSVRPDALGILLAALALNASTIDHPRWRAAALLVIGGMLPWTGLQLPVLAVILGLLIAVWWPYHALRLFLPLGVGIGVGFLGLLGLYIAKGCLYGFLAATFGAANTITGQLAQLLLLHDPRSAYRFHEIRSLLVAAVFTDRSSVFLSTAAVLMLVSLRRTSETRALYASRFAVAAAFAIPILMTLAGRYSLYYTWMGLLTVGLALVASLEMSSPTAASLPFRRLAVGCIALALVLGLPLQLAQAYQQRAGRNYDAVRAYVRSAGVAPGDWVYVTHQPYFAVAELGAVPVLEDYAFGRLAPGIPEDQRRRIKLLIVHPDEVEAAIKRLGGGTWKPSGPAYRPPPTRRLTWGEKDDAYALVAYRRE